VRGIFSGAGLPAVGGLALSGVAGHSCLCASLRFLHLFARSAARNLSRPGRKGHMFPAL